MSEKRRNPRFDSSSIRNWVRKGLSALSWKNVRRTIPILAPVFILGLILYAAYIAVLYRQLEEIFLRQDEFTPTRIYSDTTRLAPGQPQSYVQSRFKALKYKWTESKPNETSDQSSPSWYFTLREVNYPETLIPESHPTLQLQGASIELQFEDQTLSAIRIGPEEIPELYLEPELVATLTRGSPEGSGETAEETQSNEIREPIAFREFPSTIWKSIIAIEDQHYLDHKGLDPRGIARALWINLKSLSWKQGGSTITQQLVKILTARRGKPLYKKINELFLSLILEARFEKEKILERYLNEVYLGQIGNLEVHGVAEGAKYFFGKNISELNLAEISLIAGIINGPWYFSPYRHFERALKRQRLVLRRMVETGHIAKEEAEQAKNLPIRLSPPPTAVNKAPYFTDYVKAELIRHLRYRMEEEEISPAGFKVYTSLDPYLNAIAQRAVRDGVAQVEKRLGLTENMRLEGALASVEQHSGLIRVLIGGRDYAQSTFNRILNMKRQVGSTFKPVLYLTALEQGEDQNGIPFGPGYPLKDERWTLTFDEGRQTWSPRNYDRKHRGWISMRESLAHSVNITAAKLGTKIGLESLVATARSLGIESDLPEVPSLALGVTELSPVELLNVYATLANRGRLDRLTAIRAITLNDGELYAEFYYRPFPVFDPAPIDLLTDMMQNVFTEGTAQAASAMGFNRPAAGKTGTTSDHRDSWFAGFTPQLTAVAWVGTDKGKTETSKVKLTGANGALPIWVAFMKKATQAFPPLPFPESEHLTTLRIDKKTGQLASSSCPEEQVSIEKYIEGHEPQEETCAEDWPVESDVTER